MLSPTEIKDNIVVHFGTETHVLQCMADYLLPADRLPTELGGRIELDYEKWISDRKLLDGKDVLIASAPCPVAARQESSDKVMEDVPKSPKGSAKGKKGSAAAARPVQSGTAAARSTKSVAAAAAAAPPSNTKKRPKSRSTAAASTKSATSPSPPVPEAASSSTAGAAKSSSTADAAKDSAGAAGKTRRPGRKGDARMHRAVTLKIEQPEMSLVEALQEGGFNFDGLNEKGRPHHEVFDQDSVSLMQRKNQLLRRIRVEKKKKKEEA